MTTVGKGSRILVIGGTGMLGLPVAKALRDAGYAVRVLSRDAGRAAARVGAGFECVAGDIDDEASLAAALAGCEGVYVNLQGGLDYGLEPRAARNVGHLGPAAGVKRVAYISGATTSRANAFYAGVSAKLAAENALRDSGISACIFRPTWFMESLPLFVRGGTAIVMGRQPFPWHWLAAADFGGMVAASFASEEAADRTFVVWGPEAMTLKEALARYCARRMPGARVRNVPLWLLATVGVLGRNPDLRAVVPLMRYFEGVDNEGDPGPANALFGAPTTTLDRFLDNVARVA